jgi:hypothetical protein
MFRNSWMPNQRCQAHAGSVQTLRDPSVLIRLGQTALANGIIKHVFPIQISVKLKPLLIVGPTDLLERLCVDFQAANA